MIVGGKKATSFVPHLFQPRDLYYEFIVSFNMENNRILSAEEMVRKLFSLPTAHQETPSMEEPIPCHERALLFHYRR